MVDPLAEVVSLLQPGAGISKVVNGAGPWKIRRSEVGQPFYAVVLAGSCCLTVDGHEPITLQASDFVLIPSAYGYSVSSHEPGLSQGALSEPVALPGGGFRLGNQDGVPDVQLLVGYCVFASPDATLLVSLLPTLIHIRAERRLATIVQLVGEESRGRRPARDVILAHLLEVLLIEALRSSSKHVASPGLLRGLADERLAVAIRRMHEMPTHAWTVARLAREAALSRSAFFERFRRAVGVTPMEYLLSWRMALAKKLLRRNEVGVADVAERVGYSSASTFSVAFTRVVGMPPTRYARESPEV